MRIGTKSNLRLLAHASWFSVLLSALFMPITVLAEQRPSIAPAATVPSVWAWFDRFNVGPSGNAALFNGYSTAVEVCQATWPGYPVRFEPYYSYPGHPYNGITGNCFVQLGSAWAPSGQPSYYQNCPAGYYVPNATMTFLPKLGFSAYFDANQLTCQNLDAPNRCPEVAVGEKPFVLDPGGLTCSRPDQCQPPDAFDSATGQCVQCKVDPLPDLPKGDLCAQSLNKGLGKDVDGKCPQPSDQLTGANGQIGQLQCFANKIAAMNVTAIPKIPYSGPSAIIRNPAYQKHLQQIWDKMIELNLPKNKNNKACQALRNKVAAEKGCDSDKKCTKGRPRCLVGSHCVDYRPAEFSNHSTGTAFDVSWDTVQGIIAELTPLPPEPMTPQRELQFQRFVISGWLASPAACNLKWGGSFQDPDYVHFQLP